MFDRGNNHQTIFHDAADLETFLGLLGRVCKQLGWKCMAFALMSNHFHLLVETPEPNLGRGMLRLLSPYARIFHARHESRDALFGRRYGNTPIEDEVHLWTAISYVVMNPVEAGLCAHPGDWHWGSHERFVNGTAPDWLAVDRLLACFEGFGASPRSMYIALIDGAVPQVPELTLQRCPGSASG